MTSFFRAWLVASAASVLAVAGAAAETPGPSAEPNRAPPNGMQRRGLDHAAILDARLAGLKAGLRLTPDQEKLWGPFEAAVRDFAQMRLTHMQGMMDHRGREEGADRGGPPPSPIDRLDRAATRLSEVGAALRRIADAGKPLYASLDDQQKRMFGFLSREMMLAGRGHGGMGAMMGSPPRHGDDTDDDDED